LTEIKIAESDEQIKSCFPVMVELRPHLDEAEFLRRAKRQQSAGGYKLVFLEDNENVTAVAGFRIIECLAWSRFLYIDDLVTKSGERSKGYGKTLFDWLVNYARETDCQELHLDSGVERFGAHRFYLQKRMVISCHHFELKLNS
jgi:GNAT superfamily N-acetyltransferase